MSAGGVPAEEAAVAAGGRSTGAPSARQAPQRFDRQVLTVTLEIVWYDGGRKRERCASSGTADVEAGPAELDRFFLERTGGETFCPTCGHRRQAGGVFVAAAIADYLTLSADKISIDAILIDVDFMVSTRVEIRSGAAAAR